MTKQPWSLLDPITKEGKKAVAFAEWLLFNAKPKCIGGDERPLMWQISSYPTALGNGLFTDVYLTEEAYKLWKSKVKEI